MHRAVVQRAVGLDVVNGSPHGVRHAVERAELVQHCPEEVVEGHVHGPEPKAREVRVPHLGTHPDVELKRGPAGVQHGDRVPGVQSAGHAGAGDEREHRGIVPHGPGAEGLPQVSVQIQ